MREIHKGKIVKIGSDPRESLIGWHIDMTHVIDSIGYFEDAATKESYYGGYTQKELIEIYDDHLNAISRIEL